MEQMSADDLIRYIHNYLNHHSRENDDDTD